MADAGRVSRGRVESFLRRWLPWGVAVVFLTVLFLRIPGEALREAFRGGAYLPLAAYVLFEILAGLPPDAFATRTALAVSGVHRSFRELLLARGATYLLGLLSYFAGQGGVAFWLARRGVQAGRASGAVLLMVASNGIVLLLIAAAGLLIDPPEEHRALLLAVVGACLLGVAAYLALIAARPRWLAARSFLAPLFEAGLAGHLRAGTARLPHMLLLAVLHWGAFRVWGIAVPPVRGIALMPVVLLLSALPITPGGLGSTQALQVLFFSPWATGATAEERAADVLAFSLVHSGFSLAGMALVGLVCLAGLRRLPADPDGEGPA